MQKKDFNSGKVILFSTTHFIHDLYTAFLSPLLPLVIQRLNISLLKAGALLPIFRTPILLQPYIGYHADRGKASKFLPLALLITSISMSIFANAGTYLAASIILFITGVSAAFYHAPAVFLIAESSGKRYGTGMSIFMTGGELARALGPLYIVTILKFVSTKYSFIASFPVIIFTFVLILTVYNVKPGKQEDKLPEKSKLTFRILFQHGGKILYLLIYISIFQSFTKFSFSLFLPTFMKSIGFKLFAAGVSLTTLELTGAVGALIGGTVSDLIGRKKFLIFATVAIPIFINAFLWSKTLYLKYIFLLIEGAFMFSISPVRYALAQELVPEYKGTVSSLLMSLSFFTTTLSSLLTGYLGDKLGLLLTFRIISFIPLVTIPAIIFIPERKNR